MNGLLVINKPSGPTSHDVVARVRYATGIKKVGHTGTLDPSATGVLPLVIGNGTKLARYFSDCFKGYRAIVQLGVTTTTLDAEGEELERRDVNVTREAVEEALKNFRGEIEQVPPMYSAKKKDGKRLYELARQGVEVEREAKRVTLSALKLLSFDGDKFEIDVMCSPGTYIRTLAQDIGEKLGCGAHLAHLIRTSVGPFTLEQSVELDDVIKNSEVVSEHLLNFEQALSHMQKIQLPSGIGERVRNGYQLTVGDLRTLDIPTFKNEESVILALETGGVVAITRAVISSEELNSTRREKRALATEKVIPA